MQVETEAFHRIILDANMANLVYNKHGAKEALYVLACLKEQIDVLQGPLHNKLAEEAKKGDS